MAPTTAVRPSPGRGRGLFATSAVAAGGALIQHESPLAAIQEVGNRGEALACGHCLRFLGSIAEQLRVLTQEEPGAQVAPAVLPGLADGAGRLSEVVMCERSGEVFCSAACRDAAWLGYNRALTAAGLEPFEAFKEHAYATNCSFLLAARCLARAVDDGECARQLAALEARPWESVAVLPANDEVDEAEFRAQFVELLAESYDLLRGTLSPCVPIEAYSRLMGAIELNSVGVEVDSPVAAYVESSAEAALLPMVEAISAVRLADEQQHGCNEGEDEDELEEAEVAEVAEAEVAGAESGEAEQTSALAGAIHSGGGLDYLFPRAEGRGLFASIAACNHACTPNAQVVFLDGSCAATLQALLDIGEGDELEISYTDAELEPADRELALGDYGFACACDVCHP